MTAQNTQKGTFEHFAKRRHLLANWQINQLADSGALVIRLKSKRKTIEALKKNNQPKAAKELEQAVYYENKMIARAFARHYTFSKLYFIFDYSSDTLLKGLRTGFFLDTNLNRQPAIIMSEKFYLLAEKDVLVESTLGLVPDSLANSVTETGAPVKQVAIVIKNKYGHQLKRPFPYYVKGTNLKKYSEYVLKLNYKFQTFKYKNPRIQYPTDLKPFMYWKWIRKNL